MHNLPISLEIDGLFIVLSDKQEIGTSEQSARASSPCDVKDTESNVSDPPSTTVNSDPSVQSQDVVDDSSLYKLLSLFTNNIEISLSNVHIRYDHKCE